jgi:hypothetical protein
VSSKGDEDSSALPTGGNDLNSKLFGHRKYKYGLELAQDFPDVIYKERNFNLAVHLVDGNHKVVRNCISFLT